MRQVAQKTFSLRVNKFASATNTVKGGKAGRPFEVTIDPGGPNERTVDALADAEFVAAGEVIRIRTTGGGGWGDPLQRPYEEVARDLAWGKVKITIWTHKIDGLTESDFVMAAKIEALPRAKN